MLIKSISLDISNYVTGKLNYISEWNWPLHECLWVYIRKTQVVMLSMSVRGMQGKCVLGFCGQKFTEKQGINWF